MSSVSVSPSCGERASPRSRLNALLSQTDAGFATYVLCFAVIALGVFWRFIDLRYPNAFTFDEHHFVLNARNYITHQADWNDHPPLGKLLLIPGMLAFGDNGLGWRVSSAVLGVAIVAVAAANAKRLFGSTTIALLTAAFVAMDGFFISYARTALLDTPLTLFMYLALYCMLRAGRDLRWFIAAAVCAGLAVATKWTGVCVLLLAPLLLWRGRRSVLHAAWMPAVAFVVYAAVWASALALTHQPFTLTGMFSVNADLLKHHAGFTVWDNAASSRWYTWPFLIRPIMLHHQHINDWAVRATTCLGNPLLWYATTTAVIGATMFLLARVRSLVALLRDAENDGAREASGAAIALATMVALQLPFILTQRQSYIWHYLGAYGLGLALLAWGLVRLRDRLPKAALGLLVAATCVSLVYAPLWTNAVVSPAAFELRLPFRTWR